MHAHILLFDALKEDSLEGAEALSGISEDGKNEKKHKRQR